jgi:hypothetical protein
LLLTMLMSNKTSLDEIQQSAQMIETEYELPTVHQSQELQKRYVRYRCAIDACDSVVVLF